MKRLPNLISALRIFLSLCLLFVVPLRSAFYALYLLCGLSDVLDGFLARRLSAESVLGSRLDSLADFILVCVLLCKLIPTVQPGMAVLCWIAGSSLLRLLAAGVARRRFGTWGFLHTLGNKLTGALLFLYPLTLAVRPDSALLSVLCAVATVSAAEELFIELTSKSWNPDRKSILIPHKEVSL